MLCNKFEKNISYIPMRYINLNRLLQLFKRLMEGGKRVLMANDFP